MSQPSVEMRGVPTQLPPVDPNAGRRRSLDERLSVRFPAVIHLLAGVVFRLSPRSRLRRALVARRVARAYAAANRRDFDLVLTGWDLERGEYRPSPDLIAPDQDQVYYGRDGYLRMWRTWLDAFDDLRFEPGELLDLGDTLLVTAEIVGHGSGSGIAVSRRVFQLFGVRGGLVVRQEDFVDRRKALQAAGLDAAPLLSNPSPSRSSSRSQGPRRPGCDRPPQGRAG
jgi:hypothetical protein